MTKKEVEKQLKALVRKIQQTYLKYLDSLEEEGNEIGKEEGYLSVTIWRHCIMFNSTKEKTELKKENQIDFWKCK